MGNPFVHVELGTSDVAKAKSFYGELFAWNLKDVDMGGGTTYTMISVGDGIGGGMYQYSKPGMPNAWLPYVLVEDINAATAKAISLGATHVHEVLEVTDMGWLSIVKDPTGAMIGMWQTKMR